MLVKGSYFKFNWFYWMLVIFIFLAISYRTLFLDVQIQNYYFNELEDFGRYVFFLVVSFVEAFIYILFIRLIIGLLQLFMKKLLPILIPKSKLEKLKLLEFTQK